MNTPTQQLEKTVPDEFKGQRLDKCLAELFPDFSRTMLQKLLKKQCVSVDDEVLSQKQKLNGGEYIVLQVPELEKQNYIAQAMDLNIVYEDEHVLVINKPSDLIVHPGAGVYEGTLLNGLLFHNDCLANLPRAGIVHRLDKQTTGLMVVAKTETARRDIIEQLQERSVSRQYFALLKGIPNKAGRVDAPIGRHPHQRIKMAVVASGKEAMTNYEIAEKYRAHSLVKLSLETGRTHQIRVHMQHIGYPLVGDPQYAGRMQIPNQCSDTLKERLQGFERQALHAQRLSFIHPYTKQQVSFESELPDDMQQLITILKQDNEAL